jgi:diacylglycerol kinase family enzyme
MRIAPAGSHRDGKLDVCIFAPRNFTHATSMFWRLHRKRHAGDAGMLYLQAGDVTIESDPAVFTETDGELLGQTPLHVRCIPGGIDVLVPR